MNTNTKYTVGQLVCHMPSGNHGFIRALDPLTVEFSGPVVFEGYTDKEITPTTTP